MKPPDYIFETFGSHGDVLPLLSIAKELVQRGANCQLIANEHFRGRAEAKGVRFFASLDERMNHVRRGSPSKYVYYTKSGVARYFAQRGSVHEQTIIVNTHVFAASEPWAEALSLPVVRLILFPVRIKSKIAPPWPLGSRGLGPAGEHFLKVVLPAMHRAANEHPAMLERINSARSELGLAPVQLVDQAHANVVEQAAMFPEWFGMPAADWPKMDFLGFPLPESENSLPQEVRLFLEKNPKPVAFTPGTSVGSPEAFFRAAERCCASLGRPGIFLSPFYQSARRTQSPQIAHFRYVELEQLLPHASLLVHHGGMGTTARALQAGIPQIISPVSFDQPDNGHRVEVLGVGKVVQRNALGSLAQTAKALLANRSVSERTAQYAASLSAPRAVQRAADLLERVRDERTFARAAAAHDSLPRSA